MAYYKSPDQFLFVLGPRSSYQAEQDRDDGQDQKDVDQSPNTVNKYTQQPPDDQN